MPRGHAERARIPGAFSYPLDRRISVIAGLDEAGRGPLVGCVVAACVVLDPQRPIPGLRDSKCLSERRRAELYEEILAAARGWGVASVEAALIDRINIHHAALLAMRQAYLQMNLACDLLLIDGRHTLGQLAVAQQAVVRGDRCVEEIMAASILAKVTRDRQMLELDRQYPDYGFARHKGYPTPEHLAKIRSLGILPGYRRSFAPVRRLLVQGTEGCTGGEAGSGQRPDGGEPKRVF